MKPWTSRTVRPTSAATDEADDRARVRHFDLATFWEADAEVAAPRAARATAAWERHRRGPRPQRPARRPRSPRWSFRRAEATAEPARARRRRRPR